jgi:hypothetical protein
MVRPIEELSAEYRRQQGINPEPVKIVGIDIPFWDLVAVAIKLGVIWVVLGAIGYLVLRAVV